MFTIFVCYFTAGTVYYSKDQRFITRENSFIQKRADPCKDRNVNFP